MFFPSFIELLGFSTSSLKYPFLQLVVICVLLHVTRLLEVAPASLPLVSFGQLVAVSLQSLYLLLSLMQAVSVSHYMYLHSPAGERGRDTAQLATRLEQISISVRLLTRTRKHCVSLTLMSLIFHINFWYFARLLNISAQGYLYQFYSTCFIWCQNACAAWWTFDC